MDIHDIDFEEVEATGARKALEEFAAFLRGHKPSAAQLKISPDYNHAVVQALEWAADEAMKRASN